jgi:hypothetical protein
MHHDTRSAIVHVGSVSFDLLQICFKSWRRTVAMDRSLPHAV